MLIEKHNPGGITSLSNVRGAANELHKNIISRRSGPMPTFSVNAGGTVLFSVCNKVRKGGGLHAPVTFSF